MSTHDKNLVLEGVDLETLTSQIREAADRLDEETETVRGTGSKDELRRLNRAKYVLSRAGDVLDDFVEAKETEPDDDEEEVEEEQEE